MRWIFSKALASASGSPVRAAPDESAWNSRFRDRQLPHHLLTDLSPIADVAGLLTVRVGQGCWFVFGARLESGPDT
nr:hypothetical protein Ade03nite_17110 [Actinoplanes derwentensis]